MTDTEDIKDRILQVIIRDLELNIGEEKLRNSVNLDEFFGMDSIAIVELVIGIEKEFDIKIPPEDLNAAVFQNVEKIAGHVQALIGAKASGIAP